MASSNTIADVEHFTQETLKAIGLLLEHGLENQALIILYSAIDVFAWLSSQEADVSRKAFKSWCDDYMHSDDVDLRSLDLYAARCSLLHSNTGESSMTRSGEALPFLYKRGEFSPKEYRKLGKGRRDCTIVDIDELVTVFAVGIQRFTHDLRWNISLARRCSLKVENWIRFTPV